MSSFCQTSHLIDSIYGLFWRALEKEKCPLTRAPARSSCPKGEYFLGSEADPSQGYAIDNLGPCTLPSQSKVLIAEASWHFLTGGLTAHKNCSITVPLTLKSFTRLHSLIVFQSIKSMDWIFLFPILTQWHCQMIITADNLNTLSTWCCG